MDVLDIWYVMWVDGWVVFFVLDVVVWLLLMVDVDFDLCWWCVFGDLLFDWFVECVVYDNFDV